jgi:hypothetical protein
VQSVVVEQGRQGAQALEVVLAMPCTHRQSCTLRDRAEWKVREGRTCFEVRPFQWAPRSLVPYACTVSHCSELDRTYYELRDVTVANDSYEYNVRSVMKKVHEIKPQDQPLCKGRG